MSRKFRFVFAGLAIALALCGPFLLNQMGTTTASPSGSNFFGAGNSAMGCSINECSSSMRSSTVPPVGAYSVNSEWDNYEQSLYPYYREQRSSVQLLDNIGFLFIGVAIAIALTGQGPTARRLEVLATVAVSGLLVIATSRAGLDSSFTTALVIASGVTVVVGFFAAMLGALNVVRLNTGAAGAVDLRTFLPAIYLWIAASALITPVLVTLFVTQLLGTY